MAQVLAFVQPPAFGLRIGAASRRNFTDTAMAERYADLVEWRDALYDAYRTRSVPSAPRRDELQGAVILSEAKDPTRTAVFVGSFGLRPQDDSKEGPAYSPVTATGVYVDEASTAPGPSSPERLSPQHQTLSSLWSAHTCAAPTAMCATFESPATGCGT